MAEEATRRSDQLKSDSSEKIMILEEEIDRTRKDASATIQEINAAIRELKSRASGYARAEVRDKLMRALATIEKAAEKTAQAAKRQTLRLNESLRRVDKRTVFYAVGGILAAGSLASIVMGKRRKAEISPLLPEERAGFDFEQAEDILDEARRESLQAGREHVIVTPAEHYREEAVTGFEQTISSPHFPGEEEMFQETEIDTESTLEEERKKTTR